MPYIKKAMQLVFKTITPQTILLYAVFLAGLTILSFYDFTLFHSVVELIGVFLLFTVAIIAYNTYHISENYILTYLGISFGFVCMFSMLHILTYERINVLRGDTANLTLYFSIASKYLESLSLLLIPLFVHKKIKILRKPKTIVYCYIIITLVIIGYALLLNRLHINFLHNSTSTLYKKINDIFISLNLFITMIIFITQRKNHSMNIFKYFLSFLFFSVSSQILLTLSSMNDFCSAIGHLLRLCSFFCIYKGLVQNSLKEPVQMLFSSLEIAVKAHNIKTEELTKTNADLLQEIKERKQAEFILYQSEERYKELVDLLPDGLILHSNGVILFANKAALKLAGASNYTELTGLCIWGFLPPEDVEIAIKLTEEILENRTVIPLSEEKIKRLDGQIIDIEVTAAPFICNEGNLVMVIARDISERKNSEELRRNIFEQNTLLNKTLETDKIKTEFFANISHELRTPLNVISCTLQLMSKNLDTTASTYNENKLKKHFNIIHHNCSRLLRLVNNLIDLTKIDAGYLEPSIQNYNIIEIIEDAALSVAQFIETKGINLIFDTEIEEKYIACDPEKIERVILNLLSNATKFTDPGGTISINIRDKDSRIELTVTDTGIGIPPDKQEVIFERFRQVDQSLTRNHEGSGIGLSLVKSLVEMHNGKISLKSEFGKGSCFTVELPVRIMDENIHNKMNTAAYLNQSRKERAAMEFSDVFTGNG
ncbi:MAG: MASE3 domain-containing protein [Bacillota bacterium]|nr:MASE3 domain-containing protein [Bacillota bacterium]